MFTMFKKKHHNRCKLSVYHTETQKSSKTIVNKWLNTLLYLYTRHNKMLNVGIVCMDLLSGVCF